MVGFALRREENTIRGINTAAQMSFQPLLALRSALVRQQPRGSAKSTEHYLLSSKQAHQVEHEANKEKGGFVRRVETKMEGKGEQMLERCSSDIDKLQLRWTESTSS